MAVPFLFVKLNTCRETYQKKILYHFIKSWVFSSGDYALQEKKNKNIFRVNLLPFSAVPSEKGNIMNCYGPEECPIGS
jgi:hypothetical protein